MSLIGIRLRRFAVLIDFPMGAIEKAQGGLSCWRGNLALGSIYHHPLRGLKQLTPAPMDLTGKERPACRSRKCAGSTGQQAILGIVVQAAMYLVRVSATGQVTQYSTRINTQDENRLRDLTGKRTENAMDVRSTHGPSPIMGIAPIMRRQRSWYMSATLPLLSSTITMMKHR